VTLREAAAREKVVKGYGIELGRLLRGEHHGPVVYFARLSADRVKIGTTTNLRKRMRSFYLDLSDVLLVVPGGQKVEHAYHEHFRECKVDDPFRDELFELNGRLRWFLAATAPGRVKGASLAHWAEDVSQPETQDPDNFLDLVDRVKTVVADFDEDLDELDYLARRTAALDMETAQGFVEYWRLNRDQARRESRDRRYFSREGRHHARIYARRAGAALDSFTRVLDSS
jgi:hypothetical protein